MNISFGILMDVMWSLMDWINSHNVWVVQICMFTWKLLTLLTLQILFAKSFVMAQLEINHDMRTFGCSL